MTGLDPERHVIVEIATVVTDDDLNVVATGPELVIAASDEELAEMGDFVTAMHVKSGLTERIRTSTTTRREAEVQTLAFLNNLSLDAGTIPLAGNSIGTDRRFLFKYMPELEQFFHYRIIDVSTIKELAQRWMPAALARRPEKAVTHRALDDILESIAELRFYREAVFAKPNAVEAPEPTK